MCVCVCVRVRLGRWEMGDGTFVLGLRFSEGKWFLYVQYNDWFPSRVFEPRNNPI